MKNFNSLVLAAMLLGSAALSSCQKDLICIRGEGASVTDTLELPPLTGVKLTNSADVVLKQGPEQLVVVTGPQNLIDNLERDVRNGTWIIDNKRCVRRMSDMTIEVTLPDLQEARITGSGDMWSEGRFENLDELELGITGSGNLSLDMDANRLSSEITGSGNMDLQGSATTASFKTTGSGNHGGYDLEVTEADVRISGSGDVRLTATDRLNVDISGSGNVWYRGNPLVDAHITGSGRVRSDN